jgi:hypothetical protein
MRRFLLPTRFAVPGRLSSAARLVLAASVMLMPLGASAQTASCKAQAGEKKLAGAALKSFMTKCERDAKASCDASAKDKKLAGAAKTSFTKKCVTDATGTAGPGGYHRPSL